jgi:hypothetical protein
MELRPEIQIKSMIKALTDVVLPAVDPVNQLAIEQTRLVIGMLSLMAKQLPIQFQFDRDELGRLIDCAASLLTNGADEPGYAGALGQLARKHQDGARVLALAVIDPATLVQAIHDLRAATSDLVAAVPATGDAALIARVEGAVMAAAKDQLLRDRSLLLPQGWELDPAAIPPIESLLDPLPELS